MSNGDEIGSTICGNLASTWMAPALGFEGHGRRAKQSCRSVSRRSMMRTSFTMSFCGQYVGGSWISWGQPSRWMARSVLRRMIEKLTDQGHDGKEQTMKFSSYHRDQLRSRGRAGGIASASTLGAFWRFSFGGSSAWTAKAGTDCASDPAASQRRDLCALVVLLRNSGHSHWQRITWSPRSAGAGEIWRFFDDSPSALAFRD